MYMWTGKIQTYVNQGATWITVENKTSETIKGQNPLLWLWELQLGLLEAQEMQATTSEVKEEEELKWEWTMNPFYPLHYLPVSALLNKGVE